MEAGAMESSAVVFLALLSPLTSTSKRAGEVTFSVPLAKRAARRLVWSMSRSYPLAGALSATRPESLAATGVVRRRVKSSVTRVLSNPPISNFSPLLSTESVIAGIMTGIASACL